MIQSGTASLQFKFDFKILLDTLFLAICHNIRRNFKGNPENVHCS
jgi:hypothetical protein